MKTARVAVVVVGVLLPYLARLPRGREWLMQYLDAGLAAQFFLGGFNAVAWGAVLATTWLYHRPATVLFPAIPGFGLLAWAHWDLDLRADAQMGIALVFLPIYALVPAGIGALLGCLVERAGRRGALRAAAPPPILGGHAPREGPARDAKL
jgi:hypothetical protein